MTLLPTPCQLFRRWSPSRNVRKRNPSVVVRKDAMIAVITAICARTQKRLAVNGPHLLTAKRLHSTRLQLRNLEHEKRDPQRVVHSESRQVTLCEWLWIRGQTW